MGKYTDLLFAGGESSADADQADAEEAARRANPPPPSADYTRLLLSPDTPAVSEGEGNPKFSAENQRFQRVEDDPRHYAGVGTQAVASLPTDLKARARYFAAQRFPDMDPQKAADRYYGVSGGRLFYFDPVTRKQYFEEPGTGSSIGAQGVRAIPAGIASNVGPALPSIGAAGGAIATGGAGPASVAGAGAGAAGGDIVRQALARALTGEDRQLADRALQTGFEGATGAIGQGAGLGVTRLLNRGAARDLARLSDPREAAMVAHLTRASQEEGVQLTPAELTNLKSLRGQQRMVGESDLSGDELERFMRTRNEEQVPAAVDRFLGRISPEASTEVGGARLQRGGEAAIEARVQARRDATRPAYGAADQEELPPDLVEDVVDMAAQRGSILDTGKMRTAMDRVQRLLQREEVYTTPEGDQAQRLVPRTNVRELHAAKEEIDDMLSATGEDAPTARTRRALHEIQDELTRVMEARSPNYKLAQRQFRDMSGPIDELRQGPVGQAAAMQGDRPRAAAILFDSDKIGPQGIARARQAYQEAGQIEEWNAGARAWLQEQWGKAAHQFQSGNPAPGAKFRAAVFGDEPQREAMRAALSPEQYAYALRLFDVLEATGRAVPRNSDTAYKIAAMEEAKDRAGGVTAAAFRNANPMDWGRNLGQWWQEVQYGRHMEELARVITSPDAMQNLRDLRRLPPRSQAAVQNVVRTLFLKGGEAGRHAITRPEDRAAAAASEAP